MHVFRVLSRKLRLLINLVSFIVLFSSSQYILLLVTPAEVSEVHIRAVASPLALAEGDPNLLQQHQNEAEEPQQKLPTVPQMPLNHTKANVSQIGDIGDSKPDEVVFKGVLQDIEQVGLKIGDVKADDVKGYDVKPREVQGLIRFAAEVQRPHLVSNGEIANNKGPDKLQHENPIHDVAQEAPLSDLSPHGLRRRAMSFPNSSSLRTFLTEQDRRSHHVSDMCKKYSSNWVDYVAGKGSLPNLLVDKKQLIAYCPVYKAGSTSWEITLSDIGGHPYSEMRKTQEHQKIIRKFFPSVSMREGPRMTKSMTRFLTVRHPLERLLSAFRDKFEGARKGYYYFRFGEKMIHKYRTFPSNISHSQLRRFNEDVNREVKAQRYPISLPGNPYANPAGPTFPEFVRYVVDNRQLQDDHWRSYHSHCSPCYMNYEFILRFDKFYEEGKLFLEYLNRTSKVNATQWANPTRGGSTSAANSCTYYKQLNVATIKQLVKMYHLDFLLFEYDPEPFVRCARDYVNENDTVVVNTL